VNNIGRMAHRMYPNPRYWASSTSSTLHAAGSVVTETIPPNPKSAIPCTELQNWSGFPGSTYPQTTVMASLIWRPMRTFLIVYPESDALNFHCEASGTLVV